MAISLDPTHDALGVIDVQPTFMPGGALPTPDGDAILEPVNRLLRASFQFRFATQDWHPLGNITFASSYAGQKPLDRIETDHGSMTLWPDHAIQGSHQAELHPSLDASRFDLILRKGAGRALEGSSAFTDLGGRLRTGLTSLLRERGITRLFLAGLALDVCIAATAEDAARDGFTTVIVDDACRSSDPKRLADVKASLSRLGVRFIAERDLTWPDA